MIGSDELIELTVRVPRSQLPYRSKDENAALFGDPTEFAAYIYRMRRLRDQIFKPGLFQDPAWDIMLDLYIASRTKRAIHVSSACIAANVPATTALRYLKSLEEIGYIERSPDEADGRRFLVRLTQQGTALMTTMFERSLDALFGAR